jgi:hypothetical protein
MLQGIVGRVMRAKFGIKVANYPDAHDVGHKDYSKLAILAWRCAVSYRW